ncbi:MAG TPA: NDP-sugar synthase [Methylomirabilota bacterium]|nr:NDP-sugar synthase [Methylomirabilota bacterium]
MAEIFREYGGVLPCGGKGTRLAPLSADVLPKSLFPVGGKELIAYSTAVMKPELVNRLVFAVDYKADQVRDWVEAKGFPHPVSFSEQTEPGVLGAIVSAANHVPEDSMVACNTDEVRMGLDLADVLAFHEQSGTLATMVTTRSNRLSRHRLVQVREGDNRVLSTRLKPEEYRSDPERVGLINTGFLVIDKEAMVQFDAGYSRDWGGIIDTLTEAGQLSAYINPEIQYFNVGTPEEYREVDVFLQENARNGNSS